MQRPPLLSHALLSGTDSTMAPTLLRSDPHASSDALLEDAIPHGEAWLVGVAILLCTFLALTACVS